jgi:glycosyltransferase involved in cell wall biosynthesis
MVSALPELSIIMPVFNERATIAQAIEDVLAAQYPVDGVELVIVDDGSTDGTRQFLRESSWPSNVRVFMHPENRGKGAAVKSGLGEVQGKWTVTMDADLEYSAGDLPRLIEPLQEGAVEATIGTRSFGPHSAYSFWFVLSGKALAVVANMLYDTWVTDLFACQKAMSTELFRSLPLREPGFALETEIVVQLVLHGIRIKEIPVAYEARTREQGKKLTPLDGLHVLRTLIRCRLAGRPRELAPPG